jgi:hypothetical protein
LTGEGTLQLENGHQITGFWIDGKLEGICRKDYPIGRSWEGCCRLGVPYSGKGTWIDDQGIEVTGIWADGMLERFTTRFPNDEVWEGCAQSGTLTRADGVQAVGPCPQGILDGFCSIENPDGTVWKGRYRSGKPCQGWGTLLHHDGTRATGWLVDKDMFEGPFLIQNPDGSTFRGETCWGEIGNGHGTFPLSDGRRIKGVWSGGKLNGWCSMIHADGSTWEGRFRNGYPQHGHGVLFEKHFACIGMGWQGTESPGKIVWRGEIRNGLPWTGEGVWFFSKVRVEGFWEQGRLVERCTMNARYGQEPWEGDYTIEELADGRTCFHRFDGLRIIGSCQNSLLDGPCTITNPDRSIWTGEFRSGRPWSGRGFVRYSSGAHAYCNWINGSLEGYLSITCPNGSNWKGIFKNDRPFAGSGSWIDTKRTIHGLLKIDLREKVVKGVWAEGQLQGSFTIINADQTIWEGECRNGFLWSGQGTLHNFDEQTAGQWVDGVLHGPCQITRNNGTRWEGEMRQGNPWTGRGQWGHVLGEWLEGTLIGPFKVEYQELGSWRGEYSSLDSQSMEARLQRSDGVVGIGSCSQGIPNGMFIFHNPDGTSWEGMVKIGSIHTGHGVWITPKGIREKGTWINGRQRGYCRTDDAHGCFWERKYHANGGYSTRNSVHYDSCGRRITILQLSKHLQQVTVTHGDHIVWNGEYHKGRPWTGTGTYQHNDGSQQTGTWIEGARQGEFTIANADGTFWKGLFLDDTIVSGEGTRFLSGWFPQTGRWVDGLGEGACHRINSDGTIWEGELRNDLPWNGNGTWDEIGQRLIGEWIDGKYLKRNADGTIWRGKLQNGIPWTGIGTWIDASNVKTLGQWSEGETVGEIIRTHADGSVWRGECRGALPWIGEGIWIDSKGRSQKGRWAEGLLHGPCTIKSGDGSKWKGIFKEGIPFTGEGTWTDHRHQSTIQGTWIGGMLEGEVTINNPDNTTWEGEYEAGTPWKGTGTLLHNLESRLTGSWEGGQYTPGPELPSSSHSETPPPTITNPKPWEARLLARRRLALSSTSSSSSSGGIAVVRQPQNVELRDGIPWAGEGTWQHSNGLRVTGRWRDGWLVGKFNLTYQGGEKWEGVRDEDGPYNEQIVLVRSNSGVATGNCRYGLLQGSFKATNPDGTCWEGEVRNGTLWEGRGSWIDGTGQRLSGEWREGKKSGSFTITDPNGVERQESFINGFHPTNCVIN